MNETINTLQADLNQAEESLASITEAIDAKTKELATEQAEVQRLDSLILLKGDKQAMVDLVAVRATINGINEHIQELTRAQSAASARRDEAEAELLQARIEHGEVEGHLTPEELAKTATELQVKLDKITHAAFKKLEAHNNACTVLTNLSKRAKKLRGEEVRWDHEVGGRVSLSTISDNTIANSLGRYEAPRLAKAHEAKLKAIREAADIQREAADIQREAVEMSGFMLERSVRAS
ncbi:hypothetical protein [Glutamicibacter sp. AOP5-A2-18]|uniref:hypothetical protein n=1 Tax=Glutamicibacter sp. AOP5-A2-18 TaxID=3457656 RepID=UPI004033FE11